MHRNVIELAKLHSSVTGILAGFALTIVVLLVERLSNRDTDKNYNSDFGQCAILLFTNAFFTSILSSFLYAVNGSESQVSIRAIVTLLLPSFVFVISVIFIALGLIFLLQAYRLSYAANLAKIILFGTIFVALFNYTSASLDAMASMENKTTPDLFVQTSISLPLFAIPTIALLAGLAIGKLKPWPKQNGHLDLTWFHRYIYLCISLSIATGVIAPFFHNASENLIIPHWNIFISVIALSVVAGWSTIYVPRMFTHENNEN